MVTSNILDMGRKNVSMETMRGRGKGRNLTPLDNATPIGIWMK
jgi:hypothetical protein